MRYVVYNLPKDISELTQRVQLMDSTGTSLLDSQLPIAAPVGADRTQTPQGTRFNLPLKRGRYAVVITMKDAKGKVDTERRTDLVIE